MKITNLKFYDGALERICRLGISSLFLEVLQIVLGTKVYLLEERDANGAAELRKRIDGGFETVGGWEKKRTEEIDWRKQLRVNLTLIAKMGVEVQVSARSDLLVRDIVHLRNSLQEGKIDVGLIVVPDDRLAEFLPDRAPSFREAIKYIEQEFREAMTYPIVVISIEHDGPGDALPKQPRKG